MSVEPPFASPFRPFLHTNYVPTSLDRTSIICLLDAPLKKLGKMNDKISDLESILERLVAERNRLHDDIAAHTRLLTPFRRLPDDLLREIFLACLPGSHNATMNRNEAPLVLGRVCSRWRNVAYATPWLWATLHVPLPMPYRRLSESSSEAARHEATYNERSQRHHAAVQSWLARSGTCPLSISFHPNSGFTPEHDCMIRDYLQTLLSYSPRWRDIEMTVPFGWLSDIIMNITPAAVPNLQHVYIEFPHSVTQDKMPFWEGNGLVTAPQLRSVELVMFPSVPSAIARDWARLSHLALSVSRAFSHNAQATLKEAHCVFAMCRGLVHCALDIFDDDDAVTPAGMLALPHLRSLAIVESCGALAPLFERLTALPSLVSISYHTGLWPAHARPSPLLALLARCALTQVRYLSTDLRYYTLADLRGVLAAVPHLAHLTDEAGRLSNTRAQVVGRTERLPHAFSVRRAVLALLCPGAAGAGATYVPRLRALHVRDAGEAREADVLAFLRARMVAADDPASGVAPLREMRVAFCRPERLDMREELRPYTAADGGPLRLRLSYRQRRQRQDKDFHPHNGLMRRKTSEHIAMANRYLLEERME